MPLDTCNLEGLHLHAHTPYVTSCPRDPGPRRLWRARSQHADREAERQRGRSHRVFRDGEFRGARSLLPTLLAAIVRNKSAAGMGVRRNNRVELEIQHNKDGTITFTVQRALICADKQQLRDRREGFALADLQRLMDVDREYGSRTNAPQGTVPESSGEAEALIRLSLWVRPTTEEDSLSCAARRPSQVLEYLVP